MNDQLVKIDRVAVSSNAKDLKSVIEAVNAVIRTDTLAIADRDGIDSPTIPTYSAGELLQIYNYRCRRLRSNWYQHIFTLKSP